jgi:hypothetical protein
MKVGVSTEPGLSWGQVVEAVFGTKVEEKLIQPTHVVDLPKEISPLAKAWPDRPQVAQRFETYVYGWEIANAFSELNDPRAVISMPSRSRPMPSPPIGGMPKASVSARASSNKRNKSAAPMSRRIRSTRISSKRKRPIAFKDKFP